MNEPKVTVVIPTRERSDVLKETLRTVTAQDYSNLDIIVSDNFSADDTEAVVSDANDARVRYINTGKRLSMSHNWEFALSSVDDAGWVTIIGDDDGLLPDSLRKLAEIIHSTDVLAVRSSLCNYRWPSSNNTHPVAMEVPLGSGLELRRSSEWLARVLSGDAPYPQLPMLYNGGFVSMAVLKEIKAQSGAFYKSCIPDVYSAVAISSVIDRYAYSREPLAISGMSRHSIGRSQFDKKDSAEVSPAEKFAAEGNIPFHEDVLLNENGRVARSLQLLVYESYLQSRCLRPAVDTNIHAEQLEVVLATSGAHSSEISEWGAEFAKFHDLDYDLIRRKASRGRAVFKVDSTIRMAAAVLRTHFVRAQENSLTNVFEASLAAGAIRANIPGLPKRLLRLSQQALQLSLEKVTALKS
jgi:glycosyltransferase involved in cell wall biosynthesis